MARNRTLFIFQRRIRRVPGTQDLAGHRTRQQDWTAGQHRGQDGTGRGGGREGAGRGRTKIRKDCGPNKIGDLISTDCEHVINALSLCVRGVCFAMCVCGHPQDHQARIGAWVAMGWWLYGEYPCDNLCLQMKGGREGRRRGRKGIGPNWGWERVQGGGEGG